MVIKVGERWIVASANVDNGARRIEELGRGRVSPHHRTPVNGNENADREKVVFVSAARMRENCMHPRTIATS